MLTATTTEVSWPLQVGLCKEMWSAYEV